MRARIYAWAFLAFILILNAACNAADHVVQTTPAASPNPTSSVSQPPAPTVYADGVRRVTTVELKDLLASGEAIVVDVRTADAFNAEHIAGAKLIPYESFAQQAKTLPKDKLIVTYCS